MRYIVAGGRDFADGARMMEVLEELDWNAVVVCGMARGADLLGKEVAESLNLEVLEFPADWDKFGKVAGVIRNQAMAQAADALIAFWDGKSKGTKHMIDIALRLGLEVHVYTYK